jgi:hypothetical protein
MSLSKIRSGIAARQARVRQMRFEFEPDLKIRQFQEVSLKILRDDYISEIETLKDQSRSRQSAIIETYKKQQAPLPERHQRLEMIKNEMRALSIAQLLKRSQHLRELPPILVDANEAWAISAELRNRGTPEGTDAADSLSGWVESMKVDQPWCHDPVFQEMDTRVEKLGALAAQAESGKMFVLSENPDKIAQDDIVMISDLDKDVVQS